MSLAKFDVKLAIVGSRDYPDLEQVRRFVRTLSPRTLVISGGARGVDSVAEEEAKRLHLYTYIYLPDIEQYGRTAFAIRDKQIAAACERLVAFHDGKSRGTMITVEAARRLGKMVTIYHPSDDVPVAR